MTTPNLDLTLLVEGMQGNESLVNTLMNQLDAGLLQSTFLSISNNGTATDYNMYIVGDTPTGEFAGATPDDVAIYYGGWWYISPREGWQLYNQDDDYFYLYDGSDWVKQEYLKEDSGGITINSDVTFAGQVEFQKRVRFSADTPTASTSSSKSAR